MAGALGIFNLLGVNEFYVLNSDTAWKWVTAFSSTLSDTWNLSRMKGVSECIAIALLSVVFQSNSQDSNLNLIEEVILIFFKWS